MVNVIDWFRYNGFPYWKIFKDSGSDNPISRFLPLEEKDKERSLSEGLDHLKDALKHLSPGRYYIEAYAKINDTRNKVADWFDHAIDRGPGPSETPRKQDFDIEGIVKKRVAEELKRMDQEKEFAAMTAELEAYRRKDTAYQEAVSSAIGQIMPFVTKYGEQFFVGVINALNGHRGEYIGTTTKKKRVMPEQEIDETAKRFESIVDNLRRIEPEKWLDLLEALVRVHDEDPGTYAMARNFLLK